MLTATNLDINSTTTGDASYFQKLLAVPPAVRTKANIRPRIELAIDDQVLVTYRPLVRYLSLKEQRVLHRSLRRSVKLIHSTAKNAPD